jgi:hypothetical protein
LQDILSPAETEPKNKVNGLANISVSADGRQMHGIYSANNYSAGQPLTIKAPDNSQQKNLAECFILALSGQSADVIISGLHFAVTYDIETEQFSLANDDTVYRLPLGLTDTKTPLPEQSQSSTKQNISYTIDNAPKLGFEVLKSIVTAIKNHPDGDIEAILFDILDGLKTIGKDRAIDILNDLYSAQKYSLLDIVSQRRISSVIYEAIYALETLVYKDKLAADKIEFQTAAADIGVTGKMRKLMEIQQKRQQEIDQLPNVLPREPQQKLLHTKLLNEFLIKTFIEEIFLPDLFDKYPHLENSMFMFGFGRLLSEYNKLGASAGSDMDSNVIVGSVQETGSIICENENDVETIKEELKLAQEILAAYLHLDMEIDEEFTVRTFDEFEEIILTDSIEAQFYISIQTDYYCFYTPPTIIEVDFQKSISIAREIFNQSPIQAIFEENLNKSSKYSIGIIHNKAKAQSGKTQKLKTINGESVREVIGSGYEQPDNWYFSMKYTVNRFYDFLYKLESLKGTSDEVTLADAGLDQADALFIKNAHNMALALQNYALELHPENGGYLSAADFQELYSRPEFRQEFKTIAKKLGIPPEPSGYVFFQKLDQRMFQLYEKIADSKAIKAQSGS